MKEGCFRFPCYIGNIRESIGNLKDLDADKFAIVTEERVGSQYARAIAGLISPLSETNVVECRSGEHRKNFATLQYVLESLIEEGFTKRSCVIGLGGGIVGNVAGLAASLLFRGVRFVNIPTTPLAAFDSGLSLKQAVNGPSGKNQIGAFYQPSMVLIDFDFLKTLPLRQIRSGIVEVVKFVLSIMPNEIANLSSHLDRESHFSATDFEYLFEVSLRARSRITANDPYEAREGLVLEYGHTLGHALEFLSKGELTHGECVSIGLLFAAEVSYRIGYSNSRDLRMHSELLRKIQMADVPLPNYEVENFVRMLFRDTKRGRLHCSTTEAPMVLLRALGDPSWTDGVPLERVDCSLIRSVLEDFRQNQLNERAPGEPEVLAKA